MMVRAAVIWGVLGLLAALVIDYVTPSGAHLWLYGGFGMLAGGGSWGLQEVRRIPRGLVVGAIVGLLVGLIDGTMMAAANSPATLHPARFIVLKYLATGGLFAGLAVLPWSLRAL
jgi:hypothetical protein